MYNAVAMAAEMSLATAGSNDMVEFWSDVIEFGNGCRRQMLLVKSDGLGSDSWMGLEVTR